MDASATTSVGAWVAIIAGLVGLGLSLVGAYQTWRTRQLAKAKRLADAAMMAVRRVEASYVRPILQSRLEAALMAWLTPTTTMATRMDVSTASLYDAADIQHGAAIRDLGCPPPLFLAQCTVGGTSRMRLFCRLQREVRLNATEKSEAQRRAVETLVLALQAMPAPPVRVFTPREVKRATPGLMEQVEGAFQLRPRASGTLIEEFNVFCPSASVVWIASEGGGADGGDEDAPPPPSSVVDGGDCPRAAVGVRGARRNSLMVNTTQPHPQATTYY